MKTDSFAEEQPLTVLEIVPALEVLLSSIYDRCCRSGPVEYPASLANDFRPVLHAQVPIRSKQRNRVIVEGRYRLMRSLCFGASMTASPNPLFVSRRMIRAIYFAVVIPESSQRESECRAKSLERSLDWARLVSDSYPRFGRPWRSHVRDLS
jgi:hypothetical protein